MLHSKIHIIPPASLKEYFLKITQILTVVPNLATCVTSHIRVVIEAAQGILTTGLGNSITV